MKPFHRAQLCVPRAPYGRPEAFLNSSVTLKGVITAVLVSAASFVWYRTYSSDTPSSIPHQHHLHCPLLHSIVSMHASSRLAPCLILLIDVCPVIHQTPQQQWPFCPLLRSEGILGVMQQPLPLPHLWDCRHLQHSRRHNYGAFCRISA